MCATRWCSAWHTFHTSGMLSTYFCSHVQSSASMRHERVRVRGRTQELRGVGVADGVWHHQLRAQQTAAFQQAGCAHVHEVHIHSFAAAQTIASGFLHMRSRLWHGRECSGAPGQPPGQRCTAATSPGHLPWSCMSHVQHNQGLRSSALQHCVKPQCRDAGQRLLAPNQQLH